ncbi:MAG: hypothetical protein AB2604_22160, partial [Candidatus Thiodiazotropha taylori]
VGSGYDSLILPVSNFSIGDREVGFHVVSSSSVLPGELANNPVLRGCKGEGCQAHFIRENWY